MSKIPYSLLFLAVAGMAGAEAKHASRFLRTEAASDGSALTFLAVDSLGKGKLSANLLQDTAKPSPTSGASPWFLSFSERRILLRSRHVAGQAAQPFMITFNPKVCHATLLGHLNPDGSVHLPAVLHLPDYGSFRVSSRNAREPLGYDASRGEANFVRVSFPAPTEANSTVEYVLDVAAIYPKIRGVEKDPRFDGFRRNFLNIFQLNPRLRVLANHSASDACAFTVYLSSTMALQTPPLAPGLAALDLVRETLDHYLDGMLAYGMVGYKVTEYPTIRYDFLDVYPSLLIAASDYATASKDLAWATRNYAGLRRWADKMNERDSNGDGLLEYPLSGNSGSWTPKVTVRPANWWDTIGFGHQDAYSNALAYRAYLGMSKIARALGMAQDADEYAARAEKIRSVFVDTFYNSGTGVLAGWRSADGKLHDYYFTFVNSVAIHYGLVPNAKANSIMDKLLAKAREVGYRRFDLGLPGNLVPIRREDYVHLEKKFGGPEKEDGSDAFQIYENGGATACYAYFTIQALYDLGRPKDGDEILFPMLRAFEEGGFQGYGTNGLTKDWKEWDGTPHGYEGLLTDGYLTLLAVVTRSR